MTKTTTLFSPIILAAGVLGFAPTRTARHAPGRPTWTGHPPPASVVLRSSTEQADDSATGSGGVDPAAADPATAEIAADEKERVGNLVADEEWAGLSMELAEAVRTAVVEDLKKNSREFLRKDEYAMGDFSKEIDKRVKDEIAKIREKDEYELGDLSVILDDKVKEMVCEMSGKDEYEFGDLSLEIDKRAKESVAQFCGKENYEFGDLSKELAKRTRAGVLNFTGKSDYKFGDISKQAAKNFTGKDDYKFGDVTKKLLGNVFKKEGK